MNLLISCVLAVSLFVLVSETSALTIQQLRSMTKMPRSMCIQRTGASKDLVEKIQEGEFPEDPKLKCYMKCCMGMMSLLKNGQYSAEAATVQADKMLPDDWKDKVKAVIQKCKDKAVGEDACEDAFQITKCNYMEDKEVFLFP